MGEQRKLWISGEQVRIIFSSLAEKTRGALAASHFTEGNAFWNKLPRLLNIARSRMQLELRGDVLDYEPIHLHVNPVETHSQPNFTEPSTPDANSLTQASGNHLLTLDNFRFLLEQVPMVRTIEFSAKERDPLENPDLLKIVNYATKSSGGAECTIETDGLLVASLADEILKSRLHTIVIRLYSHRPSLYSLMAHQPISRYMQIKQGIEYLVQRKQALNAKVEIELCLSVDIHHYRDMPEMIRFAEGIGVNGVRFENYQLPGDQGPSDRTLYTAQKPVMKFLQELKEKMIAVSPLRIELPVPLVPDMSNHRYCLEPYNTVSVDADLNIAGCSNHLLRHQYGGKVWDPDFFNNEMYQWLRGIHHSGSLGSNAPAVPMPCRSCPRNMPK